MGDGQRLVRVIDPTRISKHFDAAEAEVRWNLRWKQSGIHHYDPDRPRAQTFVIDTPPPTVSGSLHVGHVFSYTHADVIARYKRINGFNIFYPMGWDDNGLPTERRVQNYYHVRCDPQTPYASDLVLEPATAKRVLPRLYGYVGLKPIATASSLENHNQLEVLELNCRCRTTIGAGKP